MLYGLASRLHLPFVDAAVTLERPLLVVVPKQGRSIDPADVLPPFGNEPNGIRNFYGTYAGARVQGNGTDGKGNTLWWDADVRFMKGVYQGKDGELHYRTFVET